MTGIKSEKTTNNFRTLPTSRNNNETQKDYRVFNYFCGKLPLNATSRMMGRIAGVNLPGWMRTPVHRVYGWMFNVQMNEIEHNNDLRQYSSLSHFFSRSLQVNTRPVDENDPLVSPCDGKVLSCGQIFEGHLEKVKGLNYTLNGLLGPNTWSILPNWLREIVEEPIDRPEYISVYKTEDGENLSIKSAETYPRSLDEISMDNSVIIFEGPDDEDESEDYQTSQNHSHGDIENLIQDRYKSMLCIRRRKDTTNSPSELSTTKDHLIVDEFTQGDKINKPRIICCSDSARRNTISFNENGSDTNIFNVKDNDQFEDETIEEVKDEKIYNRQLLITNHIFNQTSCSEMATTSLFHCVIYLAPGDYHKFHSPAFWKIFMRRHFPGTLFSVSPKVTNWHSGVFCANERASYMGRWKYGFFAFVAVGALNVGSIKVPLDPELKTNLKAQSLLRRFLVPFKARWRRTSNNRIPVITQSKNYHDFTFNQPVTLNYGEQFGQFNFGSTIVLIFEAPSDFKFHVNNGDKVKVGQGLGSIP